jgi:hypothetical protein
VTRIYKAHYKKKSRGLKIMPVFGVKVIHKAIGKRKQSIFFTIDEIERMLEKACEWEGNPAKNNFMEDTDDWDIK